MTKRVGLPVKDVVLILTLTTATPPTRSLKGRKWAIPQRSRHTWAASRVARPTVVEQSIALPKHSAAASWARLVVADATRGVARPSKDAVRAGRDDDTDEPD